MMRWYWKLVGASYCEVLRRPHDYSVRNGGDGTPSHFYTYVCHACGEKFGI